MHKEGVCVRCGTPLSKGRLAGQCPNCLFAVADDLGANDVVNDSVLRSERKFGDYVLGRQIGSGGMGVVYEARQISLNRKVALKFIRDSQVASPTMLRRFTIEAEAAARLHHPNIVRIHEIGDAEGQPFISMDLVDGESLRRLLTNGVFCLRKEDGGKTSCRHRQAAIVRLMAKTARAVHHAHQRGVLHRDLKPANILVDAAGEPQLTDFGLAKILSSNASTPSHTMPTSSGDIAGTVNYMAPEQVTGAPANFHSDVYGLGAILYELLTGRPPFQGATPLEILRHVEDSRPRRPRSISSAIDSDLETICLKCLEKDPAHRYNTAEDLAEDLDNWLEHKPIKARKAGPLRLTTHWVKRNPVGTVLILTLFLGLLASLGVLRVVRAQRDKIDIAQAVMLDEILGRISTAWKDPRVDEVTIDSKYLSILAGRTPPYNVNGPALSLGVVILGEPVSVAQWRARLLVRLEDRMSELLGSQVQLNLKLYKHKSVADEILVSGRTDFMLLEPVNYLRAKAKDPGVTVVAREHRDIHGVLVVRANSPIRQLTDLRGESVAFGDTTDTICLSAKAALARVGLTRSQLAYTSNFVNRIEYADGREQIRKQRKVAQRETVYAVITGQFDAGTTTKRRYELQKHHGLAAIAEFSGVASVFAARAGLSADFIEAFRECLTLLLEPSSELLSSTEAFDWDDPFPGAVAVDDSFFEEFRRVVKDAAQFDEMTVEELIGRFGSQ